MSAINTILHCCFLWKEQKKERLALDISRHTYTYLQSCSLQKLPRALKVLYNCCSNGGGCKHCYIGAIGIQDTIVEAIGGTPFGARKSYNEMKLLRIWHLKIKGWLE